MKKNQMDTLELKSTTNRNEKCIGCAQQLIRDVRRYTELETNQ